MLSSLFVEASFESVSFLHTALLRFSGNRVRPLGRHSASRSSSEEEEPDDDSILVRLAPAASGAAAPKKMCEGAAIFHIN